MKSNCIFIVLSAALALAVPVAADDDFFIHDTSRTIRELNESLSLDLGKYTKKREVVPPHRNWEVYEDVEYEYYVLEGNNLPEMLASIKSVGPIIDHLGNRVRGVMWNNIRSKYRFTYIYRFYDDRKSIIISPHIYNVEIIPELTVTLPVIENRDRLNEREAAWWDTLSSCIAEHENDHVRIMKQKFPVEDIRKEIQSIESLSLDVSSKDDVDRLIVDKINREIDDVISRWMVKVNHFQAHYDAMVDCPSRHDMRESYFEEFR